MVIYAHVPSCSTSTVRATTYVVVRCTYLTLGSAARRSIDTLYHIRIDIEPATRRLWTMVSTCSFLVSPCQFAVWRAGSLLHSCSAIHASATPRDAWQKAHCSGHETCHETCHELTVTHVPKDEKGQSRLQYACAQAASSGCECDRYAISEYGLTTPKR